VFCILPSGGLFVFCMQISGVAFPGCSSEKAQHRHFGKVLPPLLFYLFLPPLLPSTGIIPAASHRLLLAYQKISILRLCNLSFLLFWPSGLCRPAACVTLLPCLHLQASAGHLLYVPPTSWPYARCRVFCHDALDVGCMATEQADTAFWTRPALNRRRASSVRGGRVALLCCRSACTNLRLLDGERAWYGCTSVGRFMLNIAVRRQRLGGPAVLARHATGRGRA